MDENNDDNVETQAHLLQQITIMESEHSDLDAVIERLGEEERLGATGRAGGKGGGQEEALAAVLFPATFKMQTNINSVMQ